MSYRFKYQWAALLLLICATVQPAYADEATELVKAAIDYWRDVSSYSVLDMTIHRPKWERTMTLRVWTRGEKESLFIYTPTGSLVPKPEKAERSLSWKRFPLTAHLLCGVRK